MERLVEMGAEPRARLDQARQDLADAQDDAILERGLEGSVSSKDTAGQEDELVAAAQRRIDRQKTRVDEARKLMATGLVALTYVTPFETELQARQIQLDLARARAQSLRDLLALAKSPESGAPLQAPDEPPIEHPEMFATGIQHYDGMEHYDGRGAFNEGSQLKPLENAFEKKFDHPLPISADGETELHRALRFDHRGRVDVAVSPSSTEGVWLRHYLQSQRIPYYAFSHAVPGKATGAHIHIGPGSTRLLEAD